MTDTRPVEQLAAALAMEIPALDEATAHAAAVQATHWFSQRPGEPRRITHAGRGGQQMVFGQHLVVDLFDCDPATIRSEDRLREFAQRLVTMLGMKAYGEPLLPHFGHNNPGVTAGFTLVQLIETSAITGHFSEGLNSAHLDIFSCRNFPAMTALRFCEQFFEAGRSEYTMLTR